MLRAYVCEQLAEVKPLDYDTRAELGEGREYLLLNREPGFLAVT
jgi:hypothetical protein